MAPVLTGFVSCRGKEAMNSSRVTCQGDPLGGGGMWGLPEIGGPPISISVHILKVLGVP